MSVPVPSYQAACELFLREQGAATRVGLSFASRTLLIASALYLAGERQRTLRYALAGSAAIEAFVLAWTRLRLAPPDTAPLELP